MSVLIFILVNSKDKLNQKKEKVRGFTPIYSELRRKQNWYFLYGQQLIQKLGLS